MSQLLVITFGERETAGQAAERLKGIQKAHAVDIEDMAVVEKDADGKVHVHHGVDTTTAGGAIVGGGLGLLLGLVFFPLGGLAHRRRRRRPHRPFAAPEHRQEPGQGRHQRPDREHLGPLRHRRPARPRRWSARSSPSRARSTRPRSTRRPRRRSQAALDQEQQGLGPARASRSARHDAGSSLRRIEALVGASGYSSPMSSFQTSG